MQITARDERRNRHEQKDMENLGSLSFSADGYVAFNVYDTGWELVRLRKGEFTVRHEIGLEEK